tara:strand:- start:30 stop:2033 length:2004 start_codon:yes stop_codon:yes gene_type:complete
MSFSFWAKFDAVDNGSQRDFFGNTAVNGSGANADNRLGFRLTNAGYFYINIGNGTSYSSNSTLADATPYFGQWTFLCLTLNGTAVNLYINDNSPVSWTSPVVAFGTVGVLPLMIGEWGQGFGSKLYKGDMEQFRVYASELSSTDVQDIYNNSKPGSLPPLKTSSDLTTTLCNYPSGTTGTALYQFQGDGDDSCTVGPYDLTEVGSPSYVTGKFGEAISFNGTSQGVTSSSAVIPTPAATISLWFNGNGTATAEFYIIGAGVGGSSYGLDIHYYNGNFWAGVVDGGSFQGVGTGYTPVSTSEWYHLALTWDGSTSTDSMKFYINGILETNITPTVTAASLTYSSFGIGKTATSTYAPGIVDQVRIYGSVLTSQQIYDLWHKENNIQTYFTSGSTDTLVFKEGSGEITFKNDSPPGAEVGMLRYNSTLGQMEHFNSGGWKDFTNCTTSVCNYPTTGSLLYQFNFNINDTCNSSNNGTALNNPTFASGKFGQSIVFNGSNQGVTLPSILPANSSSSSSATVWFKTSDTSGAQQTLIESWDGTTGSNGGWAVWKDAGNVLRLGNYYLNGSNIGTDGTTSVADGNWHFIAVVFDYSGGTLSLYLDGNSTPEVQFTGLTPGTVNIFSGSGALGYQIQGGPMRYFPGSMDQFRIFPIALSQTQISELYNEVYCP